MYATSVSHPYGCLPSGNSFLCTSSEDLHRRSNGCGIIAVISDENIIEIMSYCTHKELCRLILSSKALYVFANHFELWRDLMLRTWSGKNIEYHKTWKETFILAWLKANNCEIPPSVASSKPMKVSGMFSNYLYRSWSCSTFDFETSCPGFLQNHDIETVPYEANLSVEDFYSKYESQKIPVILKDAARSWPAMKKWSKDYLIKACSDKTFRATSAAAPLSAEFTISQYFKYAKGQSAEEAPLYLFERDFMQNTNLQNDWWIPKYFSTKYDDLHSNRCTDLFRVFGENRRPDYRWFVIGPRRSGSIFHIDPNATHAWNCCVTGKKKWIFYPMSNPPPGVKSSEDGADVVVPVSTGEWLLSFWKFHMKERNNPDASKRPLEGLTHPGDVIFVPQGYWHMVVNLEDTIAITQNYVSTSNLATCLHFLREKQDQISGVRDRDDVAVKPESMYQEFVDKLPSIISKEFLDIAIQQSYNIMSQFQQNSLQHGFNLYRLNHRHHRRKESRHADEQRKDGEEATTKKHRLFTVEDSNESAFKFNFE